MAFIYDLSDTWNAGATTFTAIKMNVTDTASAAGSKLIDLQVGGTTRFDVDKNGQVEISAGTALLPSLARLSDTNTGMWFPAADTIAWSTGGSERMRISSAGFVGIGTSNPPTLLSLASSAAFGAQIFALSTAVDAFGPYWNSEKRRGSAAANAGDLLGTFMFRSLDTGGSPQNAAYIQATSQGAGATWHSARFDFNSLDASGAFGTRLTVGDNGIAAPAGAVALPSISRNGDPNTGFWFPALDTIAASTNGAEAIRILSSGNVGIGTSSPGAKLQVNSEIRVSDGTINLRSITSSGISYFGNITNHPLAIQTNNVERIRVSADGNVGIGTSTFGTSAVSALAIATGTAPTTGPANTIQIYSTDLSAGNTMLSLFTEGTVVNANTTAAATHRIAIRVNGTVYYLLANTAA